jgi:hypothetical protein
LELNKRIIQKYFGLFDYSISIIWEITKKSWIISANSLFLSFILLKFSIKV